MYPVARIGDIAEGVCFQHDGTINVIGQIITGHSDVPTENSPTSTVGDQVLFNCGHIGIIDSGSPTIDINNQAVARVTSHVGGGVDAVIISGATKTFVD